MNTLKVYNIRRPQYYNTQVFYSIINYYISKLSFLLLLLTTKPLYNNNVNIHLK